MGDNWRGRSRMRQTGRLTADCELPRGRLVVVLAAGVAHPAPTVDAESGGLGSRLEERADRLHEFVAVAPVGLGTKRQRGEGFAILGSGATDSEFDGDSMECAQTRALQIIYALVYGLLSWPKRIFALVCGSWPLSSRWR